MLINMQCEIFSQLVGPELFNINVDLTLLLIFLMLVVFSCIIASALLFYGLFFYIVIM